MEKYNFKRAEIHERIAHNIKKLRQEKNMTQEELAKRVGITQQRVCAIETCNNAYAAPSLRLLQKIENVLGANIFKDF